MAAARVKFSFGPSNRSRDILGVELDEGHLKVVHLQQRGLRREFINVVSHPIRGLADDALLLILRQILDKSQAHSARTYLTVPLSLVITRNIEIPSQDPQEIREIVNLQASRHTPYARAEIIVDMINLGVVRDRYTKILLVIVPKDTVNRQIQLLERAGLKLEKVIFPPEALAIAATKMAGKELEGETVGILHIDHGFTSFVVAENAKALFVRGIHIGASHLMEERTAFIDRFQDELEKSVESYRTDEVGAMPTTLMMTGVGAQIQDLEDLLADALKMKVRRVAYPDYFHLSEPVKQTVNAAKDVSFLNLLAPVAVFDRIRVDLTSDEKKLRNQIERRAKEMLKTGILTMILLSLVFAHVTAKISFKKAYLRQITKHYLPVRQDAQQLEQMLAKTELVKSYLVSRGDSLKTLTELYDRTPLDTRLSEIKYDEANQKFSIKGTAAAMSSVFGYVSDLDKSPVFKNVKTKYVNSRNEAGRDVADFEINCLMETGGRSG